MKSISEIESEITRLNKPSGLLFANVSSKLQDKLEPESLTAWAEICLAIADSGWHAWETSEFYMQMSPKVLNTFGEDRLLSIGNYGHGLCGHSFEPCNRYFKGITDNIDVITIPDLELIEETCNTIVSRFQHASNLIGEYLATAFVIEVHHDHQGLSDWSDIAAEQTKLGRHEVVDFLKISRDCPEVNWSFTKNLYHASGRNGREYVAAYKQLMEHLVGIEIDFDHVVSDFTRRKFPIKQWLDSLCEIVGYLSASEVKCLIKLLKQIHHPELADALINSARDLPLSNERIMDTWLTTGIEMAPLNFEASIAFMRIESSKSTELLQKLLGQVRFPEEQRILQLYSEALVGKRLRIESTEAQEDMFQSLPSSDGESVFLPEVVGFYPDRPSNYRWLKVALSHQLGCYEFGTFEFEFNNSYIAFADLYRTYEQPQLAADLFKILEDGRVDWLLQRYYKGIAKDIVIQKSDAANGRRTSDLDQRQVLIEAMMQYSLDVTDYSFVPDDIRSDWQEIRRFIDPLKSADATVFDSAEALKNCYQIISMFESENFQASEPIEYRGFVALDKVRMNLALTALEDAEMDFEDEEMGMPMTGLVDAKDLNIDELVKGDVQEAMAVIGTDNDFIVDDDIEHVEEPGGRKEFDELKKERAKPIPETAYKYDEWDFHIDDYRKRWCTLYEMRELEQDVDFVPNTLSQHRALANQVRKQLNMLRPELLRKVKGMTDGEELDLERSVDAIVDKKSGISPDEKIYIQRQRKDRDVSALFLLDMSASTDDAIPEDDYEPEPAKTLEDEFMHGYSTEVKAEESVDTRKKIIDLEKESVVLMAEALQGLGDSYAVCGFSGYGKDRIEYFICKDFDDTYNHRVKGKIGGIKPCRSTRMGPAIRHATRMLAATESRIKALIIISDGYPQDFDYGTDRNSKDYGVKDTTKALTEANQKGVQSFCLTVDPSGHDYLREMCPDQQYMVMQDIRQLPNELSKIYRGLTT